jgi:sensor histidine kinase regulating citrate/malate metabolism
MKNNSLFQHIKLSLIHWYISIFSGVITLGAFFVYEATALNHGGRITVESEENQGNIFRVYLPKIISS